MLKMRFGMYDGRTHTLEEVGQIFGVTRERIRQIENKAIRKLRHPSRAKKDPGFLLLKKRSTPQSVLRADRGGVLPEFRKTFRRSSVGAAACPAHTNFIRRTGERKASPGGEAGATSVASDEVEATNHHHELVRRCYLLTSSVTPKGVTP